MYKNNFKGRALVLERHSRKEERELDESAVTLRPYYLSQLYRHFYEKHLSCLSLQLTDTAF